MSGMVSSGSSSESDFFSSVVGSCGAGASAISGYFTSSSLARFGSSSRTTWISSSSSFAFLLVARQQHVHNFLRGGAAAVILARFGHGAQHVAGRGNVDVGQTLHNRGLKADAEVVVVIGHRGRRGKGVAQKRDRLLLVEDAVHR